MKIEVRVFATLRKYLTIPHEQGIVQIEVETNTKVKNIIQALNLPAQEITIIMVNGVRGEEEQLLQEGDRVAFFPPVGGG